MSTGSEQSWGSLREEVLEHDDYECRFCGINDDEHQETHGHGLDVHHLIPREDGDRNRKRNLATLCRSCHQTLENLHGQAIAEVAREEQYVEEFKNVAAVYDSYLERAKAYESELAEFIIGHPIFSSRFRIVDECPDAETPAVTAPGLNGAIAVESGVAVSSEWEFAVTYGYKKGLFDVISDLDEQTDASFDQIDD